MAQTLLPYEPLTNCECFDQKLYINRYYYRNNSRKNKSAENHFVYSLVATTQIAVVYIIIAPIVGPALKLWERMYAEQVTIVKRIEK